MGGKVVFALGVGVSHFKNNYTCVVCSLLLLAVGGLQSIFLMYFVSTTVPLVGSGGTLQVSNQIHDLLSHRAMS